MQRTLRNMIVLAAPFAVSGCFIVSDAHLGELRMDGGPPRTDGQIDVDTGPVTDSGIATLNLVDTCGDADAVLFTETTEIFTVDTRGLNNDIGACGGRNAPGNDGFIQIQVNGGNRWHFHVTTPDADRDPFLYLLDSACFSTDCDNSSDSCQDNGEEHFAFTAPGGGGTFFLGIDDRNPGGGTYRLAAYRIQCGDAAGRIHGEACDEATSTCVECHRQITGTMAAEDEVNDNEIEANRLMFPVGNVMTITGSIGGAFCTYPDVFEFTVAEGANVTVNFLKSDQTACDSSMLTPFDAVLRSNSGTEIVGRQTNGAGCATLAANALAAGQYRLWLLPEVPFEDRFTSYTMRIAVTF